MLYYVVFLTKQRSVCVSYIILHRAILKKVTNGCFFIVIKKATLNVPHVRRNVLGIQYHNKITFIYIEQ